MQQRQPDLHAYIGNLETRIHSLEEYNQQLELVIEHTGVGIWDWYVQTGQTLFNERWANIIGYTLEELSPVSIDTWMKYAHPDDLQESEQRLQAHWRGETQYYTFESRMRHKNGSWVWVYDSGQVVEWESPGVPKRMIGTHVDITDQKYTQAMLASANQELEQLVRIDPLTELPNRRAYDEQMAAEQSIAQTKQLPLTIFMIDIDHFKDYNDYLGHESGDNVLKQVAQQIASSLRRKTDFVARFGGEEFVVLLPFTTVEEAKMVCSNMLSSIEALNISHPSSSCSEWLTVSIGVSSSEQGSDNLLQKADKALYTAKQGGRNQYQIYSEEKLNSA